MRRMFVKLVCLLLCICTPTYVSALEPSLNQVQIKDELTRTGIRELAASTFPEYAENIRGDTVTGLLCTTTRGNESYVVFSETRKVSDNQNISYTLFSNGVDFVTVDHAVSEVAHIESNGALVRKTINFAIVTNLNDEIAWWDGIECVFAFNSYDNITSRGYNPAPNSANYTFQITASKLAENAYGPAYIEFDGFAYVAQNDYNFEFESFFFDVRFEAGNDHHTVTVDNIRYSY